MGSRGRRRTRAGALGSPRPSGTRRRARARRRARRRWSAATPSPSSDELTTARQSARWDEFHQHHDAGDFFKERRYLLAEFPALAVDAPTTIDRPRNRLRLRELVRPHPSRQPPRARPRVRLQPRRRPMHRPRRRAPRPRRPTRRVHVRPRERKPRRRRGRRRRRRGLPRRRAHSRGVSRLRPLRRAARRPPRVPRLRATSGIPRWSCIFSRLRRVRSSHAQVRTLGSARSRVYARGDGTLARFFLVEESRDAFANAGFEEVTDPNGAEPVRYCCVHNENRKKGIKMRRVFVHGVFRRSREPNDLDDSFRGEARRRNVDAEKGYEDWRRGEVRFVARIAARLRIIDRL